MGLLLAAWTLSSFGFWANPDATVYPDSKIGAIKNINVGKLKCGARLTDLEHLQAWCYKGARVVWNEAVDISGGATSVYYYDDKPGEADAYITWLAAYVEGNPHTVAYTAEYCIDATKAPVTVTDLF